MSEPDPDLDAIFDLIQNEFHHVDRQLGSHGQRHLAIAAIPKLARDLYLVHDIVAITCNAGIGAWIHYHHDEPGWLKYAGRAFTRIGHPQVSADLKNCHAVYLKKGDAMTYQDTDAPSRYLWDHEHKIMRSLHAYLLAHGFPFPNQPA